ncbi:hypothetical protein N7453_000241 [Penicillium expansum]|nr:hypothetical protein N7453_000241 [Penicillium expansum]
MSQAGLQNKSGEKEVFIDNIDHRKRRQVGGHITPTASFVLDSSLILRASRVGCSLTVGIKATMSTLAM